MLIAWPIGYPMHWRGQSYSSVFIVVASLGVMSLIIALIICFELYRLSRSINLFFKEQVVENKDYSYVKNYH